MRRYHRYPVNFLGLKELICYFDNPFFTHPMAREVDSESHLIRKSTQTQYLNHLEKNLYRDVINYRPILYSLYYAIFLILGFHFLFCV